MRDKSDPMLPYRCYGLDQFRHEYEALARVDSDGCWYKRDEVDAELESLRAELAAKEAECEGLRRALKNLRDDAASTIDQYNRNGPQWTSRETGNEYYDASYVIGSAEERIDLIDTAIAKEQP